MLDAKKFAELAEAKVKQPLPVQDRGDDRQERGDDELCATGTRARSAPRRYSLHTPARWAAEQRDVVCSAKQRALPRHSLLRTLSKMLPRIWKISLKKSDATYVTSPPLPMSKEALSSPIQKILWILQTLKQYWKVNCEISPACRLEMSLP